MDTDRERVCHIKEEILSHWRERYSFITPVGLDHPIFFSQIYVELSLINSEGTELDIDEVVNQYSRIAIQGKVGAGKTCLLYAIARQHLEGKQLFPHRIPLWIDFADQKAFTTPLEKVGYHNFLPISEIAYLLNHGQALLLIDNVSPRDAHLLLQLINQYHCNHFVVAMQSLGDNSFLNNFTCFSLSNLKEVQIHNLATNLLGDRAAAFLQFVHTTPSLSSLVTHPFYLSLLCNTYDRYPFSKPFLGNICQLCIDKIIDRGGEDVPLRIVKQLALVTSQKRTRFFLRQDIERICTQENCADTTLHLLESLRRIGLISKEGFSYQFSSEMLQTYFASQAIAEVNDRYLQWELLKELASQVIVESSHQFIQFTAELLPNSGTFLLLLKNVLDSLVVSNDQLRTIFAWIELQVESAKLPYSKNISRALHIGFLLSAAFSQDYVLLPEVSLPLLLEPKLAVPLSLVVAPNVALDMAITISLYKTLEKPLQLTSYVERAQHQIKSFDPEEFVHWWERCGQETTDKLTLVQEKCKHYARKTMPDKGIWERVKCYYSGNFLLTYCLYVSPQVDTTAINILNDSLLPPQHSQIMDLSQENQRKEQRNLPLEIDELKKKIDFLYQEKYQERYRMSVHIDRLQQQIVTLASRFTKIDQLLNSALWKKIEGYLNNHSNPNKNQNKINNT